MLIGPRAPYGDDECNEEGWCGGMVACNRPPFMSDSIVNMSLMLAFVVAAAEDE